jgi:hypothetical protein
MVILNGQSIFDVCIQNFGQMDNIITDVLIPNGLTFNSNLSPGTNLNIDNYGKGNPVIINFFLNNKPKPANLI